MIALIFKEIDIADGEKLNKVFLSFKPDKVVNLAAQAGVRYSLKTQSLISFQCCRFYEYS